MLFLDRLSGCRLILASHSPRRRELLTGCGLQFTLADNYEVDERYPDDLPADEVAAYLSHLKSESFPRELSDGEVLITADTVVLLQDRILGKPSGREGAIGMLRDLSGRNHRVITGVTLRRRDRIETFDSRTEVWFKSLTEEEILYYVDTFQPYDKAGAYGIQEWIGYVGIERIEGSFYNVMGLPVQKLIARLEKFI